MFPCMLTSWLECLEGVDWSREERGGLEGIGEGSAREPLTFTMLSDTNHHSIWRSFHREETRRKSCKWVMDIGVRRVELNSDCRFLDGCHCCLLFFHPRDCLSLLFSLLQSTLYWLVYSSEYNVWRVKRERDPLFSSSPLSLSLFLPTVERERDDRYWVVSPSPFLTECLVSLSFFLLSSSTCFPPSLPSDNSSLSLSVFFSLFPHSWSFSSLQLSSHSLLFQMPEYTEVATDIEKGEEKKEKKQQRTFSALLGLCLLLSRIPLES